MKFSFTLFSLFATSTSAFMSVATPSTRTSHRPQSICNPVVAFSSTQEDNNKTGESEVERLLRKARELRSQAEQAEQEIHRTLANKKEQEDEHTDRLIDELFAQGSSDLVDVLREKRLCCDTLESVVDRLDDRCVIVEGKEHVETKLEDGNILVNFEVVRSQRDEIEMAKLKQMLSDLIDAVQVLDDEFLRMKQEKGEVYVTHTEDQHWGGGKEAKRMRNRLKERQREREDQFLKRQQEIIEAQRRKDDAPPPPKVKDDHGLLP